MADKSEAERFMQAAEDALEELGWCVNYLRVNRKSQLSARLAKNRDQIKRQLMREPGQPVPSGTASEA